EREGSLGRPAQTEGPELDRAEGRDKSVGHDGRLLALGVKAERAVADLNGEGREARGEERETRAHDRDEAERGGNAREQQPREREVRPASGGAERGGERRIGRG